MTQFSKFTFVLPFTRKKQVGSREESGRKRLENRATDLYHESRYKTNFLDRNSHVETAFLSSSIHSSIILKAGEIAKRAQKQAQIRGYLSLIFGEDYPARFALYNALRGRDTETGGRGER